MTLRVAYSLGSRFGTNDSLGTVASNDVQALLGQGWLHQLLVGSYRPGSAPAERTRQLGLVSRSIRKLAVYEPRGYINALSDDVYDAWSARQITACDVFHGWGQMSLAAMRRARAFGAKTLLVRGSSHTHTQLRLLSEEFEQYGLKYPPIARQSIVKSLEEFSLADFVVVPSAFVHQSFVEQGYSPAKLIVNPYGVDTQRFRPSPAVPGADRPVRVVFVGQVALRKGIQYLLAAWRQLRLPNAELTIIGPVMPDARRVIASYQNDPTIHWVGFVNNLEEHLRQMSFFVFPSIEEGSALVTYIAMACGLPLITTFNAGSVVRDGMDGYIVPIRDVETLSDRIAKLVQNAELRRAMGHAARHHIEQFSWAHYQERLITLYRQHFL